MQELKFWYSLVDFNLFSEDDHLNQNNQKNSYCLSNKREIRITNMRNHSQKLFIKMLQRILHFFLVFDLVWTKPVADHTRSIL